MVVLGRVVLPGEVDGLGRVGNNRRQRDSAVQRVVVLGARREREDVSLVPADDPVGLVGGTYVSNTQNAERTGNSNHCTTTPKSTQVGQTGLPTRLFFSFFF